MTPDQPTRRHVRGRLLVSLLAQIALGLLAMTICLPSMQEWGATFGVDQAQVQLTLSGYVLAFGALQLVYGPLSDRFGRRRVLLFGLSLACVGSVLAALAGNLVQLALARVLQGAGSAAGTVIGRAMVQDLYHGTERTRVMAYVGMVMGLCPPLATLIGGRIHLVAGWQANFVLMALVAFAVLVAAWRSVPPPPAVVGVGRHWLRDLLESYGRLARERTFVLYVAVLALTYASFFAFLSGAPVVLRSYGVGPEGVGWYVMFVTFSYIAGNFATSRAIRRIGERGMMRLGQLSAVGGIALMLALGLAGLKTPLAFAMPLILLGLGHGFLMPPTLAGTVGVIPTLAGAAAAVAGLMQQLMGAIGSYVVGWVPHDGATNLGIVMMTFTLCSVGAQIALHRR